MSENTNETELIGSVLFRDVEPLTEYDKRAPLQARSMTERNTLQQQQHMLPQRQTVAQKQPRCHIVFYTSSVILSVGELDLLLV